MALDYFEDYAAGRQQPDIVSYLLVKVASRCNIDCSYCYWFRDQSVYDKPKLMGSAVLAQLLLRVEEQITRFALPSFSLLLHGGEPLLWGAERFRELGEKCTAIKERTGCPITLSVTTNGLLIDEIWLECFARYDYAVSVSIDGPSHIHDIHRRTFDGGPTHQGVQRAIEQLKAWRIPFGVLAVCNPAFDPNDVVDYFMRLGIDSFDILMPDATHEDRAPSIAAYYCRLFDRWLDANRTNKALRIRLIEDMIAGLLGGRSGSEGIGYGAQEVCTVMSDGTMEPLDVLRIAANGSTNSTFSIFDHALDDIKQSPQWQSVREASLNLCEKCRNCKYAQACGGGYLPHRYSKQNGYDNPSAYCDDLYATFEHIRGALDGHIHIATANGQRIAVGRALAAIETK